MVVCVLCCSVPAASAATSLVRGPYLQKTSTTSTILRWRTLEATNSVVRYGLALDQLSSTASDSALTTEHRIPITGLLPDTKYYYTLESENGTILPPDPDNSFRTNPLPSTTRNVRIWVLGDSGRGNENQLAVLRGYQQFAAQTGAADLMLMLGDNAYMTGQDAEYQLRLFDVYASLLKNTTLWPTFGNHDGMSSSSSTLSGPYYDSFSLPRQAEAGGTPSGTEAYYSFDYGPVHFICLNSFDVDRSSNGTMAEWLKADLAASALPWKIAYWHHPPYSKGSHDSDRETELMQMRENIVPLLEDGGVDLVLSGHSHSYERSFLVDGHYGPSSSLTAAMIIDGKSGDSGRNEAYHKPLPIAAHRGTVYMVAGNSAEVGGGTINHPVMSHSAFQLGSLVIDVAGDELHTQLVGPDALVSDQFTLKKNCSLLGPCPKLANALSYPSSERREWGNRSGNLSALRFVDRRFEVFRAARIGRRGRSFGFSGIWGFRLPPGAGTETLNLNMISRRNLPMKLELAVSQDGVNFQEIAVLESSRGFNGNASVPLPYQFTGSLQLRLRSLPVSPRVDRLSELKLNSIFLN